MEIIKVDYLKHTFKYDFLNMSNSDTVNYIWNQLIDIANKYNFNIGNSKAYLNEEQSIFMLYSI